MPLEHDADPDTLERYETATKALAAPATHAEATALLAVLPAGEDSCFGLAWALLHFIETAPNWPEGQPLDDRSHWVTYLRERAERGAR
jgi:hypothetical protein